ncbi:MAG: tRNA lysidine(34) synthetase TilS [Pseudomonadota bacterium]
MLKASPDAQAFDATLDGLTDLRGLGVAVSGGSDSLGLLVLFATWRRRTGDRLPATVFTVNHGLRPEAEDECAAVCRAAVAFGLDAHVLRWAPEQGVPISQSGAREARYALLSTAMGQRGLSHLLLGHTRDDQSETVLMRLAAGSGADGLAAMRPVSTRGGMTLVRPALGLSRAALRQVCVDHGLSWVDDPTNGNPDHRRPRIRAARKALDDLGLTTDRLSVLALRMGSVADSFERLVDRWLASHGSMDEKGFLTLPFDMWGQEPTELRRRILKAAIMRTSGRRMDRLEKLETLERTLSRDGEAATLGGCRVGTKGGRIVVTRERRGIDPELVSLVERTRVIWDNRFEVVSTTAGSSVRLVQPQDWPDILPRDPSWANAPFAARTSIPVVETRGQVVAWPGFATCYPITITHVARRGLDDDAAFG